MKKETNEVLLSVKELQELGVELSDLINDIELSNVAIEGLEFAKKNDKTTFLWIVETYFNCAYALNEKLLRKLDRIACMLINIEDEQELEELKNN